jgi:hypothetical protein
MFLVGFEPMAPEQDISCRKYKLYTYFHSTEYVGIIGHPEVDNIFHFHLATISNDRPTFRLSS